MISVSALKDLYAHMKWADAHIWHAVEATANGHADDQLINTLLHLHLTQRVFLDVWKGRPVRFRERSEFASATAIQAWVEAYHEEVEEFISTRTDADLQAIVEIPWAHHFTKRHGRPPAQVTLGETAYQVVAHSMYHRGQANRRIREIGGEPPLVDYIVWLWMDRPAD